MTKIKSRESLVIKLAHDLADIRTVIGRKGVDRDAREVCRGLEGIIVGRLDRTIMGKDRVLSALLASGSTRLSDLVFEAEPLAIHRIEPADWPRLLKTTHPDVLRNHVGRGLSLSGISVPLIGHLANGHTEWEDMIDFAARTRHSPEHDIIKKKNFGLMTAPRAIPYVAAYLRADVIRWLDTYEKLATNFLEKADFYRVALLNLAGMPLDKIVHEGRYSRPTVQRFLSTIQSAHGKMTFMAQTRSLENLLTNPEAFEEWRQNLARQAGETLPPV